MDIKEKVTEALQRSLHPEHIELEDDDGISGFVVSSRFHQMPSLERQMLIAAALRDSTVRFTRAELRHVLAIAALTPTEYEALGYREKPSGRPPSRKKHSDRNGE